MDFRIDCATYFGESRFDVAFVDQIAKQHADQKRSNATPRLNVDVPEIIVQFVERYVAGQIWNSRIIVYRGQSCGHRDGGGQHGDQNTDSPFRSLVERYQYQWRDRKKLHVDR